MAKNNKRLYESIMSDVSKSVRRKMYENYVEDNEYLYDDIMESVSKIVKRRLNEVTIDDFNIPMPKVSTRMQKIIDEFDKEPKITPDKLQKISDLTVKYKIEDEKLIESLISLIEYHSPKRWFYFSRELSRSGYQLDDSFFAELAKLLK